MKRIVILIALALIATVLAGCSATGNAVSDDTVKIPLSEVSSTMKKYSLDVGNAKVKYFVVRGADGQVRTAFDACDVCGGYKGYRQQGGDVICNNCGRSFRIADLGTKNVGGGCWPSFLSHRIEDGNVVIDKAEISQGAHRFR